MMKKNMLLLALCLGLALAATSCSDDRTAAGKAVKAAPASMVDKLSLPQLERQRFTADTWVQLLSQEPLAVTDTLITSFFDYYSERPDELRYLPEFDASHGPDAGSLNMYAFMLLTQLEEDTLPINREFRYTREQFAQVIKRALGEIPYPIRSSGAFTYQDGIYTADGFDNLGAEYYRLKSISRQGSDQYLAAFDMLSFGELELYDGDTPNMQTLFKLSGLSADQTLANYSLFMRTLKQTLLRDDYDQLLELNGEIAIRFSLSGDDQLPFAYHACTRTYPNPYY